MSALDGLDAFALSLWLLRIAFLAGLYLFLLGVGRMLLRDLRVASATTPSIDSTKLAMSVGRRARNGTSSVPP